MTDISACPACAATPLAQHVATVELQADTFLSLPTIHCAACMGKVERALCALPGVSQARVNLSLKRVAVTGDAPIGAMITALDAAGYPAYPLDAAILTETQDTYGRGLLSRLAVAGFAMMNVMLLSVAVWSGATDATRDLFHLISGLIAVPVVFYSGQPFFHSAWAAIRVRRLNMDVPISLAIILATGMSLFETVSGGAHAYFDAALSLTFFLLIGRYLDHRTRAAAHSAAKELSALEVRTAYVMQDGAQIERPVDQVALGDTLLIPTGTRVPVDGDLMSASATTDRSFLTGESDPITLSRGGVVQAGEINLGAPFRITATAVGEDTTLRRVAALVEMAENSRNSYTALADRAAQIYAPAVHLLAFIAFCVWLWITGGDVRHALNIAIAVLIITCPCALGLAVPAVATAAVGTLYGKGVLVKSGTALERLAEVDTIISDKTGTLTLPGVGTGLSQLSDAERAVALALAQSSDHPVSRAVVAALAGDAPAEVATITEVPGKGVTGVWNGQNVKLGKASWLGLPANGLALQIGVRATRLLGQSETLRPGAAEAITALQAKGYDVSLMSGDQPDAVSAVAEALGGLPALSGVSAEEKHAHLTTLADAGKRVLMIGDGLNDAACLAAAHAAIAPATALDASRNAADVVLLGESLAVLPQILAVARKSTGLSRGNIGIAATYNLIAVPIAFAGLATPLLAALAMSASSVMVLLNALRVRRVA